MRQLIGEMTAQLSHHLSAAGHEHVLLERERLGQRWIDRWDSLSCSRPTG